MCWCEPPLPVCKGRFRRSEDRWSIIMVKPLCLSHRSPQECQENPHRQDPDASGECQTQDKAIHHKQQF